MNEETKEKYYGLKVGNFRNIEFDLHPSDYPEDYDFDNINPDLKKDLQISQIYKFCRHIQDAEEFPPVVNPKDYKGLNRTLSLYLGHGFGMFTALSGLVESGLTYEQRKREQRKLTNLAVAIDVSYRLCNTLNYSTATGRLLMGLDTIQKDDERNYNQLGDLNEAREKYKLGQLDEEIKIACDNLHRTLEFRTVVKDFGYDLIQRLLDDPDFDILDDSFLTTNERNEYTQAEDIAYNCFEYLMKKIGDKGLPTKEDVLEEKKEIDESLSGLEVVIQRFQSHVLDYSKDKKKKDLKLANY